MDKFIEWLNAVAGRRVRLAEHLGVKPPVVSEWVTSKRSVPIVHGAAIEAFTERAVTRRDLFPDTCLHVWPELADPAASQAGQGACDVKTNQP